MRRSILLILIGLCACAVLPRTAAAQQTPAEADLTISRAVVATDVQDREPLGEATSFGADVGTVYFYTVFEGDFGERQLEHVWIRDGEEMARVPLAVRGPRWRTWSSKAIPADWSGNWTVRVVDEQGTELESIDFTVGG